VAFIFVMKAATKEEKKPHDLGRGEKNHTDGAANETAYLLGWGGKKEIPEWGGKVTTERKEDSHPGNKANHPSRAKGCPGAMKEARK